MIHHTSPSIIHHIIIHHYLSSGKSSKMGILFYNSFFSALMMVCYLFVEYQYYEVKNHYHYYSLSSLDVIMNSNHDLTINENQNIIIPTTNNNNNMRVLLSNQLSQYRHNNHYYDNDVYNYNNGSSSSSSVFIGIYHDTNDYFHIYNSKEYKLPFITRISNHSDNDLDYHDDKEQDSSNHDLHHIDSIDIDHHNHNQHQNDYQKDVKFEIPKRNLRQLVDVDVSNNNNNNNKRVTTATSSTTTTTTATSIKHDEINSIKNNNNNNIVSIDEIKKANELLLEKHYHLNQLIKDTYHQQKIYKNYSTISELYQFDGWYDINFLFMLIFTCFMGSVLNYAIFICTAMNSALTTAVIGALKNIATTYFAMIIFSDYEFTWLNFMGINISTIGSFYYTYITLFKKSGSSSNSGSGVGNSGSNISCDSSSNDISDGGNISMETLKERAL